MAVRFWTHTCQVVRYRAAAALAGAFCMATASLAHAVDSPLCDEDGLCSFAVPIPQNVDFWDIAVAAAGETRINDRAWVYADASRPLTVISSIQSDGGYVRIGADATVGHVIGSGEVVLEDRSTAVGNVYATTHTVRNSVDLGGSLLPFTDIPWATSTLLQVSWPTTTQPQIELGPGQPAPTLYPDAVCGKLKINGGATFPITQPGDYFFRSLDIESGGRLLVDVGSGTVRLFVEGEIILNGQVEEVLDPGQSPATTRVLLASLSTQGVPLNDNFDGVVLAPAGKITARGWLDSTGWRYYRGAFFGKEVELHQGGVLLAANNPDFWTLEPPPEPVDDDSTVRDVPTLGFLDGTNCEHWPVQVRPTYYLPGLIDLSDDPNTVADADWLNDQLVRMGYDSFTEIGSPRRLEFRYYLEPSEDGDAGLHWVIADPDARKAYDISYARLCTGYDVRDSKCTSTTRSLHSASGDEAYIVLGRTEPRQRYPLLAEEWRGVLVTAPEVSVPSMPELSTPDRIELDVSLIIAAGQVSGAPDTRLAVKPAMLPLSPDDWVADLAEPSRPGVLAVFAEQVSGFASMAAYNGLRIGRVSFLEGTSVPAFATYPVSSGSDTTFYRELQLPKAAAFGSVDVDLISTSGSPDMPQTMPDWWCEQWDIRPFWSRMCFRGGYGMDLCGNMFCDGTLHLRFPNYAKISQRFWFPTVTAEINEDLLVRREFEEGGAVLVSTGAEVEFETLAPPAPPLTVDPGPLSQPPEAIPTNNFGQNLIRDYYYDSRFWPLFGVHNDASAWRCNDPIFRQGRDGSLTYLELANCNALGSPWVEVVGYGSTQTPQGTFWENGNELTAYLNGAILASWSGLPTSGPSQVVRTSSSVLAALNGAQLVTDSTFFQLLYDAADTEALALKVPGEKYVTLARLADEAAPDGEDLYVPFWLNDRAHQMASNVTATDLDVGLNALGIPYGRVAAPWFPILANADSEAEVHLSDVVARWDDVVAMIEKMHEAAGDVDDIAKVEELAAITEAVSTGLISYSEALQDATKRDLIGKTEAQSQLLSVVDHIDSAREDFENGLRTALSLPTCSMAADTCDFMALQTKLADLAAAVLDDCAKKGQADVFPGVLDSLATISPLAQAAVTGIDGLSTVLSDASEGKGIIRTLGGDLPNWTYKQLADDFKEATKGARTAGVVLGSISVARDGLQKVIGALQPISGLCQDAPGESAAIANLTDVAQNLALLDTWALQVETIYGVLSSIESTLQYQLANKSANNELHYNAIELNSEIENLMDELRTSAQSRADFVAAACELTTQAARVHQAELYGLSQMLQTSVGQSWVKPGLVIPAEELRQASGSLESVDELEFEFFRNAWDSTPYDPAATFADQAQLRFSHLIWTNTCRNFSTPIQDWPMSVSVVRRVLSTEELAEFKTTGTTRVTMGLSHLMDAHGVTDYSAAVLYDDDTDSYVPLSSPAIVSLRYSACTGGTPEDPCCDGCARTALVSDDAPALLLQGGALVPSHESCATDERATARLFIDDEPFEVSTCLLPVAAPNMVSTMQMLEPGVNTEEFIMEGTDDMCSTASASLPLNGVRGLPLLGSWTLTHSKASAQDIGAFKDPVPPSTEWLSDNAAISGFELDFFIIAEPSASHGEPTPFTVSPSLEIAPYELPTCADGTANGAETDIDCGGSTCAACALGQLCIQASDCETGVCTAGVCAAAAGPCTGLCSSPVLFSGPSYSNGSLGTGSTCHATLANIAGGNCGNFATGRTFRVNGQLMTCNWSNWPSLPAKRNGGYCFQASAGDYAWAGFTTW
jgi:hypothetical protein